MITFQYLGCALEMTMWKNSEQEEYEASAPAVKAHFHALRAEEAWKKEEYALVEREARMASERFIEAANSITDKRTIDALMLLAENYEYRAHEAKAKLPDGDDAKENGKQDRTAGVPLASPVVSTTRNAIDLLKVGGNEAMKAEGFTQMSTGLESIGAKQSIEAESQLNQAAEEIEELWRRLMELGLSTGGNADKNHVLMSSRHLSSSLGDSFCLLPTKARTPIGANAVAIDGGSTLRAAVASRMRNQRVRLMEKQYGPRAAVDTRVPQSQSLSSTPATAVSFHDGIDHQSDRRSSLTGRGSDIHDPDNLHETVKHQKYEIVRLLNTVKTLSNENTTLLKKCDALTTVQDENRELQDSMEKFKTHYNQKLVMIKRALEEWRRQQNESQKSASSSSLAPPDTSRLQDQLQQQQQQIQQLQASLAKRDSQVAKYEQWYQTLKAGARAKRNQSHSGDNGGMKPGPVPRDSFTNSSSLHELHGASTNDGSISGPTTAHTTQRPPAHPTRRAL